MRHEVSLAGRGPVAALVARLDRTFVRRVGRYGCVGVAVSVFYSLAVIACVRGLHPITPTEASVIAFVLTLPVSYLAHGRVTFADRPADKFQPLRFGLSTAMSFVVAVGGMYWITEIAGRSYLLGIAWNFLIIPGTNFLVYLLWVFRPIRNTGRMP